jgi:hypothetical protein
MDARLGLVLFSVGLLGCGGTASSSGETASDGSTGDETGETEGGTTGPSEPPWGEPIDPCQDVSCSGHGTCVAVGLVASCECEPGFVAKRHECIACTPLGEDRVYDVDVPMVTVQPQLTFAGGPPPPDGFAYIYLASGEDSIRVMRTDEPAALLPLLPGTYDFRIYRHEEPYEDDPLPDNDDFIFATEQPIVSDGDLAINIPVAEVTVGVTVNGEQPNHTLNGGWFYAAIDRASQDRVEFEELEEFIYFVDLIPGVYDMRFSGGYSSLPDNFGASTGKNVFIAKSGHIALDVPAIEHHVMLTVGGQVLGEQPRDWYGDADVSLFSPELGTVWIGDAVVGGEHSVRLMPGTYDILYELWDSSLGLPDNERAIIPAGLTITTDGGTTHVDIPIVTRSGTLTVNGVAVAANEWGAELYYINQTTGDRVLIRDLAWGEYEIEMIPGVYDLLYSLYAFRPNLPSNSEFVLATGIVIDESGITDLDVPMITVAGAITVNGQIAGQPEDEANIYFRPSESFGRLDIADVSAGAYSVNMIPGIYDVFYDSRQFLWEKTPGLPSNQNAPLFRQVAIDESGTFDIDVSAVEVTGLLTIAGQAVPGGGLSLYDVTHSTHEVQLATSGAPYTTLLLPGIYEVAYGRSDHELPVPQNTHAVLDCIIIE